MDWGSGQFILIDKEIHWTSFDVVKKIRNHLHVKIGHAGTLDPLATGLLILATGKFTKRIEEVQGQDKVYTGIIELGKRTPSYDLETVVEEVASVDHLSAADVETAAQTFTGVIEQVPPQHSAVKVDGERAYKKARKNELVKLKSRQVSIHQFEVNWQSPEVHFNIACSKGTYIRSLANDLGAHLGVGGYLKSLRRTRIGAFSVEHATTVQSFIEHTSRHEDSRSAS